MDPFQQQQQALTAYLRDPESCPAPQGIEPRRLAVYRDLFYKNIEGFISGGFPVCRSIFPDDQWHAMGRDFMKVHHCQSPYFLQIAEEFLHYLSGARDHPDDPPFLRALAHYEWVELALDTDTATLPAKLSVSTPLVDTCLRKSPLAWSLSYPYPVHRISKAYQPLHTPGDMTYLVVYRDRSDAVRFMEINAVTARLLALLEGGASPRECLASLATELAAEEDRLVDFAESLLQQLLEADILCLAEPSFTGE